MDVSIIIVNYNTKRLTLQCIESIFKSRPKARYEIIVVDNASRQKPQLPKRNNLYLIENQENLGLAKAVNQGIKEAKGRYILLLNSDTKVKKGVIDKLLEFANKTPDAGVVAPKLINPDGSPQPSVFNLPTIWRAFCPRALEKHLPSGNKPIVVESPVMAAYLITPRAIKEVGLLDEKYFLYFEDHDYSRRVKQAGLRIYYLPTAKVIHQHGASGGVEKQLVASAKLYHGVLGYYFFTLVLKLGQKLKNLTN